MTIKKRPEFNNEKIKAYFKEKIEEQEKRSPFANGKPNAEQKELMDLRQGETGVRDLYGNCAWNELNKKGANIMYIESPTEHQARIAVGKCGDNIKYCPENVMTEEVCLAAVSQNGLSLRFIPSYKQTQAICRTALISNKKAVKYISSKIYKEMLMDMKYNGLKAKLEGEAKKEINSTH